MLLTNECKVCGLVPVNNEGYCGKHQKITVGLTKDQLLWICFKLEDYEKTAPEKQAKFTRRILEDLYKDKRKFDKREYWATASSRIS